MVLQLFLQLRFFPSPMCWRYLIQWWFPISIVQRKLPVRSEKRSGTSACGVLDFPSTSLVWTSLSVFNVSFNLPNINLGPLLFHAMPIPRWVYPLQRLNTKYNLLIICPFSPRLSSRLWIHMSCIQLDSWTCMTHKCLVSKAGFFWAPTWRCSSLLLDKLHSHRWLSQKIGVPDPPSPFFHICFINMSRCLCPFFLKRTSLKASVKPPPLLPWLSTVSCYGPPAFALVPPLTHYSHTNLNFLLDM